MMLIRFIVGNFLSFNDEVEFSMLAGKSRKHLHHVVKGQRRNGLHLLKAGVIYGANASGKSNLIRAMDFARELIIEGIRPKQMIPLKRFQLDANCTNKLSKFEFEFKYKGKYYLYGFETDQHKIHNEWLYEIVNRISERKIFERVTTTANKTEVEFGQVKFSTNEERQFFEFTARGTRYNQLFLTESIERGIEYFANVYTWFRNLTFIFPETQFAGLEIHAAEGGHLVDHMLTLLQIFNIGISGISVERVDIDREMIDIPNEIKNQLLQNFQSENKIILNVENKRRYLIDRNESGEVIAFKLMIKHKMKESDSEALFEISDESDGTRRLIELLPALIDLIGNDRVYIVDELDRSLHPTLSYKILEFFLNNKDNQESQLIVTTHESSLLNLNLLRRDEIWFVEKDKDGASSVYSLEEFTPRYDNNIRKGYLLGRFGAIPIVQNLSDLGWAK